MIRAKNYDTSKFVKVMTKIRCFRTRCIYGSLYISVLMWFVRHSSIYSFRLSHTANATTTTQRPRT